MRNYLLVILSLFLAVACNGVGSEIIDDLPPKHDSAPTLKGKLVYHNYTTYESYDSEMWLYDFESDLLVSLSKDWNISNPMNAHFSPDGKSITFMGIGNTGTWDIYLYNLNDGASPTNLTPTGNTRDEDPKFSPDGKKIIFKQNSRIAEMNLSNREVTILSAGNEEYSMPYYNSDGSKIVCSKGIGTESSIVLIDLNTKEAVTLYDVAGVQNYYPIGADEESFYFTVGHSPANRMDQIHRGYWNGLRSKLLPFNKLDGDYSDPYPVDDQWIILSSTRTGTKGEYDLYIANVLTGDIFSMSDYNHKINTSKNELGASIYVQ